MSARTGSPRETVERFLKAVVGPAPGEMADCYAEKVVIEMPFASGLVPERLENTREEIRQRFAAGATSRRYTRVRDVHTHETADPDVLVLEYRLDGERLTDGEPFTMSFVMVLTFRDGLIAHSRDYTDPIAAARALGRLPELAATLKLVTAGDGQSSRGSVSTLQRMKRRGDRCRRDQRGLSHATAPS